MRLSVYREHPELRGWYFMRGAWWYALHLGRYTVLFFKRFPL